MADRINKMNNKLMETIQETKSKEEAGIDYVIDSFICELKEDDYCDLIVIISIAADVIDAEKLYFDPKEKERQFNLTMAAIYKMLSSEQITAGDLNRDWTTFSPWRLPADKATQEIADLWNRVGRLPNPEDETVWFKLRDT